MVQTSIFYASRLADAKQSNNAITGNENYILNEQWVNALLLKILEYGRDTLSIEEISQLETLAKSCPAVEGLSVYKARVLYTNYEPMFDYNDYVLCNPQNKNGEGLFNNLMNFLNNPNSNQHQSNEKGIQINEQYKLYPVPSSDILNIEYDFVGTNDAELIIFDVLGREVLKTHLLNSNTKVLLSIVNLKQGIYTYNIKVGQEKYTGKLIKQ